MTFSSAVTGHPTQEAKDIFDVLTKFATIIHTDRCGETSETIIRSSFWGGKIRGVVLAEYQEEEYNRLLLLTNQNFPRIYELGFYGYGVKGQFFSGHSFLVIQYKSLSDNQIFFKVVQSYVDKWHVADDLKKFEFDYLSRDQLLTEVVDPFFYLLKNKRWYADEQRKFLNITRRTSKELGEWVPSFDEKLTGCLSYTRGDITKKICVLRSSRVRKRNEKIRLVVFLVAFVAFCAYVGYDKYFSNS